MGPSGLGGSGHSRQEKQHEQRSHKGPMAQYQSLLLSLSTQRDSLPYISEVSRLAGSPDFPGRSVIPYQRIWLSFEDKERIYKCSEEAEQ